jgi:hypothetical protein
MVETASTTKTKTKRMTTTIAAMIVIATIIAFPIAANKLAFAAVVTTTPTECRIAEPCDYLAYFQYFLM